MILRQALSDRSGVIFPESSEVIVAIGAIECPLISFFFWPKRHKVRGHRAIAQFSGADKIIDGRYSARVSSCDRSRKAIVCRVELLNGGFRAVVASTRFSKRALRCPK